MEKKNKEIDAQNRVATVIMIDVSHFTTRGGAVLPHRLGLGRKKKS